MPHRIIQVHTDAKHREALSALRGSDSVEDLWKVERNGDEITFALLVRTPETQAITDRILSITGKKDTKIVLLAVEAVLPREESDKVADARQEEKNRDRVAGISREELYANLERGAALNRTFVLLVLLSAIVAAIGLIEDNVAVVIGAMVIAPLLGPNIALALATTLGDIPLMRRAIMTNLTGVMLSLAVAFLIGFFWSGPLESNELMTRTDVGYSGIVLAIASGAAAVLSLTTGLSSVLVGVMVAVALLPPAMTMGLMAGSGNMSAALGAGLLLAVNVVCVNLAAKVVFLMKGVGPRTWYEKRRARGQVRTSLIFWGISLVILIAAIYLRRQYF